LTVVQIVQLAVLLGEREARAGVEEGELGAIVVFEARLKTSIKGGFFDEMKLKYLLTFVVSVASFDLQNVSLAHFGHVAGATFGRGDAIFARFQFVAGGKKLAILRQVVEGEMLAFVRNVTFLQDEQKKGYKLVLPCVTHYLLILRANVK